MTGGVGVGGNIYAAGTVTSYSDEQLKINWNPLPHDYVSKLAAVKYGTYTKTGTNEVQVDVSAQSLQKVLPEAVYGEDVLSVAHGNAAMVSAVALAKEVVELRARIAALEQATISCCGK